MIPDVLKGFIVLVFVFIPLERMFALHGQKIFRVGWQTDLTYYFTGYFIGKGIVQVLLVFSVLNLQTVPVLSSLVASQPVWLQFLEAAAIADFCYYFAHKLLHTVPWLWKFHAVHHSTTHLDWLATVRVHPFDQVFTKTCQIVPLYCLGFSSETLAAYALFCSGIAFLIHSNMRIQFGFLKWLIATPQFHHWHHDDSPKLYNKNFAAQFPFIDLLFGTLYMPKDRMPDRYGLKIPVPTNYFKQLVFPFKIRRRFSFFNKS
ncbi:sterol desaturase family protein [Tumidithrix helvetica PCC 7403]|uniref:sterol desaturase family protein n=1 Tax=Tumidithrix helvetica TaxID=3457545 RepID=UPI003CA0C189